MALKMMATCVSSLSERLPLASSEEYDSSNDTCTLGHNPDPHCRQWPIAYGDRISYWQDFGSEDEDNGYIVTVDLRRAHVHLAAVISSLDPSEAGTDEAAV